MENTLKTFFAGIAHGLCDDDLLSAARARRICLNEKVLTDPVLTARFLKAVLDLSTEAVRGRKSRSNRWVCACLNPLAEEISSAGLLFDDLFSEPLADALEVILRNQTAGIQENIFTVEGCGLPDSNSLVIRKSALADFGSALASRVYADWGDCIKPVCKRLCDTSDDTGFLVFCCRE